MRPGDTGNQKPANGHAEKAGGDGIGFEQSEEAAHPRDFGKRTLLHFAFKAINDERGEIIEVARRRLLVAFQLEQFLQFFEFFRGIAHNHFK